MLKGRAVGGPRHGVVLTAGIEWEGIILRKHQRNNSRHYYQGRYIWHRNTWEWIEEPVKANIRTH
ncbi:MAG: hypothetical protein ACREQA_19605 [Candidatus Binatia bacterium]